MLPLNIDLTGKAHSVVLPIELVFDAMDKAEYIAILHTCVCRVACTKKSQSTKVVWLLCCGAPGEDSSRLQPLCLRLQLASRGQSAHRTFHDSVIAFGSPIVRTSLDELIASSHPTESHQANRPALGRSIAWCARLNHKIPETQ